MNPPTGFVDLVLIRCYECHRVIADKQIKYETLVSAGWSAKDTLTHLNVDDPCCREKFINPKRYIDQIYKRDTPTSQTWREPGRLPFQTSENIYKKNFRPTFDQEFYDEMTTEGVSFDIIDRLEEDFFRVSGRRLITPEEQEEVIPGGKVVDLEIPF